MLLLFDFKKYFILYNDEIEARGDCAICHIYSGITDSVSLFCLI